MKQILNNLALHWGRRQLPILLQTEATECGLACVGMIAGYHRYRTDLATLRRRFPVSLKGATLAHLMQIAQQLDLATRAVKLDLEDLKDLRLPCILHWDFNHFVVLKTVNATSVTIYDPAVGIRKINLAEVSRLFTGVALELWPSQPFTPQVQKQTLRLRDLLGNVTGLHRSLAQIFALALSLEVLNVIHPFFLQWVIDHAIVSVDRSLLTTLALGFGLLMVMQQVISTVRSWALVYMSTTLGVQWQANVFSHLTRLPLSYFEKRHLGDIVSRFGEVNQVQQTLTNSFLEAVIDGLMVSVTLVMMFIYSTTLAWLSVGIMSVYAIIRWLWYRPLRHATAENLIHAAKQSSHFLETMRGIKAIKLFQRQHDRQASWLTLVVNQTNTQLRAQKLNIAYDMIKGILFGVGNIGLIWLGARMVMDGLFTVGALMAFAAYRGQFENRMSSLIAKYVELKMLRLHGERLADIVLTVPEAQSESMSIEQIEKTLSPTIEVVDLRFRYSEYEPYILDGVNFKIAAGESVALVGPSGCGKSTLMQLLLGVLSPTSGDILIGGVSIRQLGLARLRSMLACVLQDDVLFSGSIADNISFFDSQVDFKHMQQCADRAAIAADIESMPMAYNTFVGDMGTILSGGQKQRILLARALYKQAPILLLDEATSHLDVALECQVNAAVRKLNTTRLIIAHRPETIASADRVITIMDGKVIG